MTQFDQRDARRFTTGASVALGVGALLAVVASIALALPIGWAIAGWAVTSAIGMWQGVRSARLHGSAGPAIVKTLAIGLSARALLLLGVGAMAVLGHRAAAFGAIAGMAASFVPLFLFESHWFVKRSAGRPAVPRGPSEA